MNQSKSLVCKRCGKYPFEIVNHACTAKSEPSSDDRIARVRDALREYHAALKRRESANTAAHAFVRECGEILGSGLSS